MSDDVFRRRQVGLGPAVQQAIFIRVLASAVIFFALTVAAAYFTLVPLGKKSVRAVVPVLQEFMLGGQAGNLLAVHRLYSSDALRTIAPEEVAAFLAERDLFEDYAKLQVTRFQLVAPTDSADLDRARVEARVYYTAGPAAVLTAQMALDNDRWRFDWVALRRGGP